MKNLATRCRLSLIAIALLLLVSTEAGAQMTTVGQVVEVPDARSVTVEAPTGRLSVELAYIEVPELDQQLHGIVKSHLEKLLLAKTVHVKANGFMGGRMRGQLFVNGVDVSCQMLRDGAAWHIPRETSGQDAAEYTVYASYETIAKNEKRGVWSIPGLQPAWLFRAEKAASTADTTETKAATQPVANAVAQKPKGYWADKNPWLKNPGLLLHGYNAATQTGFLATPILGVSDTDMKPLEKMAVEIAFRYTEKGAKGRPGDFVITIFTSSGNAGSIKSDKITVHVDGKKIVVARQNRQSKSDDFGSAEKLTYQIDKSTMQKMVNAADFHIEFGTYNLRPKDALLHMLLQGLVEAAS